ncbi:MAG: hypothetical protein Q9184_000863 [Pyrenodesmia sp. 2 TL-2023]
MASGSSITAGSCDGAPCKTFLQQQERRQQHEEQTKPLQLLDLPIDILQEILKEVTHTNDLTSLALTCSALHREATPLIYSRFDIVWPDVHSNADSRQGVDALTYGLSTLVMGQEPSGVLQTANYVHRFHCTHCGMVNVIPTEPDYPATILRRRRAGNHYPHYTRKFSLGNGPDEWIKEYLINRESGKMLGTLVALALARMPNLESFVWDMPTGILRDCWLALSSTDDSNPCLRSSLEKVWVRFHDNREILDAPEVLPTASQGTQYSPGNPPGPSQTQSSSCYSSPNMVLTPVAWSYKNTEWPNFSVLPPLRSLNVLNIDEIAYLVEMSSLIKRSVISLRELRIGLASTVPQDGFSSTRDLDLAVNDGEPTEYQYAFSRLMWDLVMCGDERLKRAHESGALSSPVMKPQGEEYHVIGSQNVISDPFIALPATSLAADDGNNTVKVPLADVPKASIEGLPSDPAGILGSLVMKSTYTPSLHPSATGAVTDSATSLLLTSSGRGISGKRCPFTSNGPMQMLGADQALQQDHSKSDCDTPKTLKRVGESLETFHRQATRLSLETLELEYMHVDSGVLLRAIDWTVLTTLTLLNCDAQDHLWRALRRAFTPRRTPSQSMLRHKAKMHLRESSSLDSPAVSSSEYRLKLRRVHTNCVSSALMAFLKETLAPNSLEWLFLQDGGTVSSASGGRTTYDSAVSVETIYRGPLRRHRQSLKKLMIDSDDRPVDSRRRTTKWHKWKLERDALSFVTSGKMTSLRELSIAIDYQDWHFLLQRLPQVPQVRTISIRQLGNHPYGQQLNAKDLALQVMDIVSLRPEMELCYLAIVNKCFEILEGSEDDNATPRVHHSTTAPGNPGRDDTNSSDEDSNDDEEDDDDVDANDDNTAGDSPVDDSDLDSQAESTDVSEDELAGPDGWTKPPRLKLREILFYDLKISIFKARHGKL